MKEISNKKFSYKDIKTGGLIELTCKPKEGVNEITFKEFYATMYCMRLDTRLSGNNSYTTADLKVGLEKMVHSDVIDFREIYGLFLSDNTLSKESVEYIVQGFMSKFDIIKENIYTKSSYDMMYRCACSEMFEQPGEKAKMMEDTSRTDYNSRVLESINYYPRKETNEQKVQQVVEEMARVQENLSFNKFMVLARSA